MKKLRNQIPKNIYERAQVAEAGDPDFYAGPTIVEKSPNGSAAAANRNARLQERMKRTKERNARKVAQRRASAKVLKAARRRSRKERVLFFFGFGRAGDTDPVRR